MVGDYLGKGRVIAAREFEMYFFKRVDVHSKFPMYVATNMVLRSAQFDGLMSATAATISLITCPV